MSSDVIRSTLMVPQKIRYLRYASFLVIAEYPQVRLIPRDLQALISALFTKPSEMRLFYRCMKVAYPEPVAVSAHPKVTNLPVSGWTLAVLPMDP